MAINFGEMFDEALNNAKLEEVFNKTKDVAETVGKKSAERLEFGRKKVELLDAKAKLARLYEKYGKLQYNAVTGDEYDEDEMQDCMLSIGEYKEKVKHLTQDIEAAKTAFNETAANAAKHARDAWNDFNRDKSSDDVILQEEIFDTPDETEE